MSRKPIITLLLLAMLANMAGCSLPGDTNGEPTGLTIGLSSCQTQGMPTDGDFEANIASFSVELFKQCYLTDGNTLISPLSVALALAMTANGADGTTLAQMEHLLGGSLGIDELNVCLSDYVASLPVSERAKLEIASSIWLRDAGGQLVINPDFLQRNADFYDASVNVSAFDQQTAADINNWASQHTDGMIDKVINDIDPEAIAYLINAVAFDAEWLTAYGLDQIESGDFHAIDGSTQRADFMFSNESLYLDDGKATGFVKHYTGGYSFVALLPNERVAIDKYVRSLSGKGFIDMLVNAEPATVQATLPKFGFELSLDLGESLKQLGMPDAFDANKADFNKMTEGSASTLYITEVLHKTYINVDELGTKAGAVSSIGMAPTSGLNDDVKVVRLDRPFVFAIVDNATNLPVFIGTVLSVK